MGGHCGDEGLRIGAHRAMSVRRASIERGTSEASSAMAASAKSEVAL